MFKDSLKDSFLFLQICLWIKLLRKAYLAKSVANRWKQTKKKVHKMHSVFKTMDGFISTTLSPGRQGDHTMSDGIVCWNIWSFELKNNLNSQKPRRKCLKIPAAAAVLCSSWSGPAVLTSRWSLGGALAPPKTLQVFQLDRADVTPVWSIKATSTPLLVWKSHDMSPSIHNYVTDIFAPPSKRCQHPTVLILQEKSRSSD